MTENEIPAVRLWSFVTRSIIHGPNKSDNTVEWFFSILLYWKLYLVCTISLIGLYVASIDPLLKNWPEEFWAFMIGAITVQIVRSVPG